MFHLYRDRVADQRHAHRVLGAVAVGKKPVRGENSQLAAPKVGDLQIIIHSRFTLNAITVADSQKE